MESKLEREVRFLKIYAVGATLVAAVLLLTAFTFQGKKQKFDEIDVERINVVEKDGKLDMVISNNARQHPGISNGKIIKRDSPRPPGMIFFDQTGDEMGGLIFGDNGGKGHFGSLTFDKVSNDQAIGFRYLESDSGQYESGLAMWQPPNVSSDIELAKIDEARKITDEAKRNAVFQTMRDNREITVNRLFLGKRRNDANELLMADTKGRPRIRLQVAPDGSPRLEFLDEQGNVTYRLPEITTQKK